MKTLKNLIITAIAFVGFSAFGQSYLLSSNLTLTNTVAASATLTYTGTNYLDLTRYQNFTLVATGAGTNYSTNTVTFTFKAGPTTTNWEVLPSLTLFGTVHGTNPFVLWTNLSASGIGYLKPYQIINSATNELTNVWTYGQLKVYPRN